MEKGHANHKVTAQHVADAVGVDKSAVYQAISGRGRISPAKREQILEAAGRMGYHVDPLAKRLREGRGHVDIPIFSYYLDRGVLVETVLKIQSLLTGAGYSAPVHVFYRGDESGPSQAEIIRRIRMERPRALVCAESFFDDASLRELELFQKSGGLVVTVGFPSEVRCDQVVFSERENTCMAVRHLLKLGHRRIGFCTQTDFFGDDPRVGGIKQALDEYGVPFERKWMFDGGVYGEGGANCARQFLALAERPTGMAIVNDFSALAFMAEVARAGVRVPEDVSVVGHDGLPEGAFSFVRLTTVTRPADALGQAVVSLLSDRLEGRYGGALRTLEVRGELVVRESTAPFSP